VAVLGDLFPAEFLNPDGDGSRNYRVRCWYIPGDRHLIRLGKDKGYPLTESHEHPFIVVLVENGRALGYPRSTSPSQRGVPHKKHVPETHTSCKVDRDRGDGSPARITTYTLLECSLSELNDGSYSCEEPENSAAWNAVKKVKTSRGRQ